MPATPESSLSPDSSDFPVKRLGVIAGGGDLPAILLHACEQSGIEPFVVALEGQVDPELVAGREYMWSRPGAAGHIIQTLQARQIIDLVLIGSIRRPSLAELRPDLRAAQFFARVGLKALGDDGLLTALRAELERDGFRVRGVQEFVRDLLVSVGVLGKHKPHKDDWNDIRRGMEIVRMLGALDIGQAAVVQEGIVLGVEAAEGTDALIRRCAEYRRSGRGGVLVKACKPQQDKALDLPAIGPETVRLCIESGLEGVVFEAGRTLVIRREDMVRAADAAKLFILAADFEESLKDV